MPAKEMLRPLWNRSFGRLDGQYIRELNTIVGCSCGSLLDVGCGFNSPVQHLYHRPARMVGIDAFLPAIEESRAKAIHDEYRHMSVLQIDQVFGPESFDCVLASDVIEHLLEEDALNLISKMQKVSRAKIIIFTPNGFLPQGEHYGNPLQRHLSGWTVKQMETLGYRVIGIEGIKWLRGEMAGIIWHPRIFWLMISLLSQSALRDYPAYAFRLLCVKEKGS